MSSVTLPKIGKGLRRFSAKLRHNESGIAAVEFAYVVPLMLLMLVGSIEVSRAISMDRKFSIVTSMTGDLVAREKDLGTNPSQTLDKIMEAIDHVMAPYDTSTLKIGIIPVMAKADDETDTFVYAPPYAHNGAQIPAKCAPYALPPGLVGKGGSVIVVEAEYQFRSIFQGQHTGFKNIYKWDAGFADYMSAPITWEDKSTHSPRHSCVDFEGNNCVVSCS